MKYGANIPGLAGDHIAACPTCESPWSTAVLRYVGFVGRRQHHPIDIRLRTNPCIICWCRTRLDRLGSNDRTEAGSHCTTGFSCTDNLYPDDAAQPMPFSAVSPSKDCRNYASQSAMASIYARCGNGDDDELLLHKEHPCRLWRYETAGSADGNGIHEGW